MTETPYRANRLFGSGLDPNYDRSILKLAQRIELKEDIGPDDVNRLDEQLNERHGEGITLLFHALASGNVSAVDILLSAGADTEMTDKPVGSVRNFPYMLALPGGPLLSMEEINQLLQSYLRNGGDPNATWGNPSSSQDNLPHGLALIKNIEGFRIIIEAGGDPWKPTFSDGERRGNAMDSLAASAKFDILDEMIDRGYFDGRSQTEIQNFLGALGGYSQRRDERSLEIKRIAKRVLKRNPDFIETVSYDGATRMIFKDHWKDEQPGIIPWDEILSEAVD